MKANVDTAEELVEILTSFIFISGPGHSAGIWPARHASAPCRVCRHVGP